MDLRAERIRLLEQEAYGVKTAAGWNRYHEERRRQTSHLSLIHRLLLWARELIT